MKYMPIFRYRASEKKTLETVNYSNKILPLVEIIQEKRKSNMKTTCFEDIIKYLNENDKQLLIDFPMYVKFKKRTVAGVVNFLSPILANPSLRLSYFDKFKGQNIIPVISYNPNVPLYQKGYLSKEFTHLRSSFQQIGLRIFLSHAQEALNEAATHLKPGDIIIVDLDNTNHDDPILVNYHSQIVNYAKKHMCKAVIVRSVISPDIANTKLTNNSIVNKLDNSLLIDHKKLGFDAFGDYCGIKKDELTDGGKSSPGCIFFHWWTNSYYGHKGVFEQPDTFTTMVAPSLVSSYQWIDYQTKSLLQHQDFCPGCKTVFNITKAREKGNSAPKWKIIISSHYLHTMEEFL